MLEQLRVSAIYISPIAGEPMQRVAKVNAIKGVGLEGDRYAKGEGFWQTLPKPREAVRQVSIVSKEALEEYGFTPDMSRRNIVIEGESVDFTQWVGKEIIVAGLLCKISELCDPCNRPSRLSEQKGFEKLPADAGGVRAEILQNGILFEGAVVLPPQK